MDEFVHLFNEFFDNPEKDLLKARVSLKGGADINHPMHYKPVIFGKKSDRKKLYDYYMQEYELLDALAEGVDVDKTLVTMLSFDNINLLYSRSKSQIDECIDISSNLNGDVYIYRSKHVIDGVTIFTVMYDTTVQFYPNTLN